MTGELGGKCTGATWERCLFQTNGCVAAEAVQFARRLCTVLTNVLLPPCAADGAAADAEADATERNTVAIHTVFVKVQQPHTACRTH